MNISKHRGAMKPKLPIANRIAKTIAIFSILALGLFSSCAVGSRAFQRAMKQPIIGEAPHGFPVLAFWFENGSEQMHAKVLGIEELSDFRKQHPTLFFTLPDGRGQELDKCLRDQAEGIDGDISKQYSTGRRMQIVARIESSSHNEQLWRVKFQHGNDHVNVGYYRANRDSFTPTHIERFFGPALAFRAIPFLLAGWAVVWGIAVGGIVLLSRIPYFNASKWHAHAT